MKLNYLATGLAALAMVATAQADVTVNITGATAFRKATLNTIKARYVASGAAFKFAHDQAAGGFNGSTKAIFIGTFPGISGVTTIRTNFTGSVEGIRALVSSPTYDVAYFNSSILDATTAVIGGAELASQSGNSTNAAADIAFSDVAKAATPYASASLLPSTPECGVVTFTMIANNGAPANLTNVTAKQFQALFSNGTQPLSLFTGDANDITPVYAFGRNDGSGTRTTYLAETGFGITKTVQQYVVTSASGSAITQIQRVPAGGGSVPANASTVWGQDVAGNGGYNSGSTLKTDLTKTSANTEVLDANGTQLAAAGTINFISWLATGDALTARQSGAKILGYNGVTLSSLSTATTLDAADRAKIANGAYTAWTYERMYRLSSITSGDKKTAYDGIKNNLGAQIAATDTGLQISDMLVGRTEDGGIVAP